VAGRDCVNDGGRSRDVNEGDCGSGCNSINQSIILEEILLWALVNLVWRGTEEVAMGHTVGGLL